MMCGRRQTGGRVSKEAWRSDIFWTRCRLIARPSGCWRTVPLVFLAPAIFKGRMICLHDERSLILTFRRKQMLFFVAAELWTVRTVTQTYRTSFLTWTGEWPIHLLHAHSVTAALSSSPSVLSPSLRGRASLYLSLSSCLLFSLHPFIPVTVPLPFERVLIHILFIWLTPANRLTSGRN